MKRGAGRRKRMGQGQLLWDFGTLGLWDFGTVNYCIHWYKWLLLLDTYVLGTYAVFR